MAGMQIDQMAATMEAFGMKHAAKLSSENDCCGP